MSQRFKVWRTDVGDEAVTVEIEAHNPRGAAIDFAEQEWAKDQDESMELEIEDSFGNRWTSEVEIEMEPVFDASCRPKQPETP